jgi:uncharacterized protein (TIGR00251 family)
MIHGTTRLRDRQTPGKGLNTGEERQHATGDPCALLPGNILFTVILLADISGAVSEERQGVVIAIEVTTGAKEAVFPSGYNEWRRSIGCRVTAPAIEGRANKAIIRLVAENLGVPASSVSILSGATSSQKRVFVAGKGKQQVLDRLGTVQ